MRLEDELGKCLDKIGDFTPMAVSEILSCCCLKEIPKGDFLLRPSAVSNSIHFLIEGAAIHYDGDGGDEGIFELYVKSDCMVGPGSFLSQQPSSQNIRAFSDSKILSLSIYALHELVGKSASYFQLGKVIQPSWFKAAFYDQDMSPDQKYAHLLEHKPEIVQQFPLKVIASYLKISPETLSRVRARLVIS
ncbi:Crp/Fnr family transcriptional regulator [Pedobacter sp. JY14-1]|uniref:Crp/Fnr family transcriptional regulator n=1 Tax=Pedobacter sp. JY14-1 TaxID=3034151 RepID=UPI0023E21C2A|nr:Crp/Fnr family transcriptional regulator [Pedobacter sp. JY14-1]